MWPAKHTYWSNNKYKCSWKKTLGRILKFRVCFSPLFWIIKKWNPFFFFLGMFPQADCSASAKHTLYGRKDKQVQLCTWSRTRDPTFKTLIVKTAENLTWVTLLLLGFCYMWGLLIPGLFALTVANIRDQKILVCLKFKGKRSNFHSSGCC